MDQPVEPSYVDLHPGFRQRGGVGLPLVAQRVVLRGDDDRRGQAGEVRVAERREPRVRVRGGVGLLIAWIPLMVVGLWFIYRIVAGWLRLLDRRPMYE